MDEVIANTTFTTLQTSLKEFRALNIDNHTSEIRNYKKLVENAKNFQQRIANASELLNEEKETLTSELSAIFEAIRKLQEQDWQVRRNKSEEVKQALTQEITTLGDEYEKLSNLDSQDMRKQLTGCENRLRKMREKFRGSGMVKEDHDEVWYFYQEVWEKVNERKRYESYMNREKFINDAETIRETLRTKGSTAARDLLREVQKNRNGFFFLQDDFKKLQTLFDDIYREISGKTQQRRSDFHKYLEASIASGKGFLERAHVRADKIRNNLNHNKERMETARSEEFRDKVEKWMKEDTKDLEKILKKIEKVENEVAHYEEKLRKRSAPQVDDKTSQQITDEEIKLDPLSLPPIESSSENPSVLP
ncbi:MAG: hypothetical protein FJ218_07780 [Ignavibacteria bacterium]|nr:hypothetical protein [Ignavibacteria bacterium]